MCKIPLFNKIMETKMLMQPSPSTINQMYTELGTSETKLDLDVKILKEWMRKQPHLPNPDDDENIIDEKRLKTFLLMCKNSLEKTKVMLDQHYTVKLSAPEYFSKWDPTLPEIVRTIKQSCFLPLPNPTREGHRVGILRIRTEEVGNVVFDDFIKLCFMTLDLRISKLDTCKKEIGIIDCTNMSMNYVAAFIPCIKKIIESVFGAYPLRTHGIHLINTNSFVNPLINLSLTILKKKVAGRMINHKSIEDLKNYIEPSVLPLDYGGTYPKTSDEIIDDWYDELKKHREWLIAQSSIVADNSKRPKNSINHSDDVGNDIEGSFRKIEVD
ncbi:alpha-tocopherol transfer protein-like isoform X1 [Adelges cooleyi]|uniref:alpha-tocopherol transfer protein-like isoform X1 n=1 Tax=Adelges cooleyi TaxID=133065 RepID=UPI00217FF3BB|nr:alpha-tocopherol transfer protein-like isoform X1 [Adelges cooleyi]